CATPAPPRSREVSWTARTLREANEGTRRTPHPFVGSDGVYPEERSDERAVAVHNTSLLASANQLEAKRLPRPIAAWRPDGTMSRLIGPLRGLSVRRLPSVGCTMIRSTNSGGAGCR